MIRKLAEKTGKYSLLLICILIALILYPVLENTHIGNVALHFWCIVTMLSLALSLQDQQRHKHYILIAGGFLTLLLIAALISQFLNPTSILFFSYIIWIILASIFRGKKLGGDELCGSIVSYLLLGITWALLYSYIELIAPNSFSFVSEDSVQTKGSALFYYSFVTLTTLGYGDILPVSQFARMVTYLEAVTGVMYTAILVAGLVGNIGKSKKN
jgi:hypothetical protein